MPRLLDKIRHEDWDVPVAATKLNPTLAGIGFDHAESIVVDDVTSMHYEDPTTDGIDLRNDCPNSTPPFPFTWVETRCPSIINVGGVVTPWEGPKEWGFLFSCIDLRSDETAGLRSMYLNDLVSTDLRWAVTGTMFFGGDLGVIPVERTNGGPASPPQVIGPVGTINLPLNSQGQFMDGLWSPSGTASTRVFMNEENHDWLVALLEPLWYGLSVANCSNVRLVEGRPHRSDSRRWKRETGKDVMTYKTIHLGKDSTRRTEHNPSDPNHHVSLHLCRGHFRTYTKESPLGGRPNGAVGTFWIPSHMRGTRDKGIVVKDYDVTPRYESAPALDPDQDGGNVA